MPFFANPCSLTCRKFRHTTQHGAIVGKTQEKEIKYYNLDVIISVGYRVKSPINSYVGV
ncbi:RhuM family protein [Sediminibacterium sp.]|uniref:RhuM family protein n=1 Tax=Sediminibacterium sp. TaxID=1917865 RepID=UPI00344FD5A7